MLLSVAKFLETTAHFGYKVFSNEVRDYNINIVGWRTPLEEEDSFSDFISVYWRHKGYWESKSWPATTRPGTPWLFHPENINGTAVLVPGQYVDAYSLGDYKGYTALRQVLPVRVYRDNNRDSKIDKKSDTIEEGLFGIQIHKAGAFSKFIGLNSAGCQVFQKSADFEEFIDLCTKAAKNFGNKFTYTLLEC